MSCTNGGRKGDNFISEGVVQVGNIVESEDGFDNPQRGRIYSDEGVSPCLNTEAWGNRHKTNHIDNKQKDM